MARLDFATHSPYITQSQMFMHVFGAMVTFRRTGLSFFITFAAVDGTRSCQLLLPLLITLISLAAVKPASFWLTLARPMAPTLHQCGAT
jgi:hypothetical protein